jgi:hypothetical protein
VTAKEISAKINGEIAVDSDFDAKEFYVGDFLSRVMGKAPSNSVWITVMSNVNVAGVAVLAEIKIVVLCEGVVPAPQLVDRCREENIALVTTDKGAYECCRLLA